MRSLIIIGFLLIGIETSAQTIYSLDASQVTNEVKSGYFKMGDPGLAGKELLVNSRYLTIGGVPKIPVMGELQYSRMPKERWEDEILKMKAGGVTVIATYVFWIHQEEVEGEFDWSGNKDLRSFVKLCQRLGVLVYPRIGPWAHGETRNGGTPDWILRKKYLADRSIDPVYQSYVERYFRQIGLQLKGLMYKDGGPVVGIQLENEYWKGKAGEPYISWLKQTALKYGMNVPLYTVTGWGDGSVPLNEVIPLWGGYPDESWTPNIEKITGCDNYTFSSFRDDITIGNAQVIKKEGYDYSLDPYFTCEMGVGIFNSIHRRPIIGALDGLGLIVSRIGSGGNLLGYYVFAGGSNPLGIYSTMEENKDETGYWSELSPISYDFQAAIRENGLPAPSFYEVKRMNYFLGGFGALLAPMEPVFAAKVTEGKGPALKTTGRNKSQSTDVPITENTLQYAARVKGNSGFLFGINYCRNNRRPEQKGVRFQVRLKDQTLLFPSSPVNIPDSSLFIWPMNLDMDGIRLNYATAQPLFRTRINNESVWIFVQDVDLHPEFSMEGSGIDKVVMPKDNGQLVKTGQAYILSGLRPGPDCIITVHRKDGTTERIILLGRKDGRNSWILPDAAGKEHFYLSRATLYTKDNELHIMDTVNDLRVLALSGKGERLFTTLEYHLPEKKLVGTIRPKGALQDAQWLVTSVKSVDAGNLLYHREFQKEFSAGDPARIKSARLILAPGSECRVRINDKWVEQPIRSGRLNVLDITGYVEKGDNVLLMDFPFAAGGRQTSNDGSSPKTSEASFAARVLVEYFNTDRLDFSTDTSWLTTDLYYFPATYGSKPVYPLGFATPLVAEEATGTTGKADVNGRKGNTAGDQGSGVWSRQELARESLPDFSEWRLPLSCNYLEGLNNVYLDLRYQGDRISVRANGKLIADNLNNNTDWLMDLKRGASSLECQELQLELRPWKDIGKMYFDRPPAPAEEGKAIINTARLVPEYKIVTTVPQ